MVELLGWLIISQARGLAKRKKVISPDCNYARHIVLL